MNLPPNLPSNSPPQSPCIGLFGGSFDPVHRAHLALAHTALRTLGLHSLRWVPAGQPWQKLGTRDITPAVHRLAMLQAALAHEPRFVVDPIELDRPGPSYTLDTVRALRAAEPGVHWVLLIGQDQHARLHTWHGWQALLGLVELAVARRPGVASAAPPEVLAHPHRELLMPLHAASSSAVREAVRAGHDLTPLVTPEVARYIAQHRLYAGPTGS